MLEGNNFNAIPSVIFDLRNTLYALRFSHQNVTHLPENIGSLSLGELDLRNNNISSLSESFDNFKNLKLLYLHHNMHLLMYHSPLK